MELSSLKHSIYLSQNKDDDDGHSFPALIHVLTEAASDDESNSLILVLKSMHLHEHHSSRDKKSNNVHMISENGHKRVSTTHSHCDVHPCRSQTCCACRYNDYNNNHRTTTTAVTSATATPTTTFVPVTQVITPREIKCLPHKWWEVGWKDSPEESSTIVDRITSLFFASLEAVVPAE